MKRAMVFVLSLFFCVLKATTGHSADEPKKYWLAFSNGTVGLSLMQIDSNGNILKPLRLIIDPKTVGGTPDTIAISKNGSDQLNLWTYPEASTLYVTRVRVDKNTFQVRSIKKTNVTSTNAFYLQVTQKRKDNFLSIFHDPKNRLRAAGISTTGVPDGMHWWLAPVRIDPTECRSCRAAGVSSDGRFAFYVDVEFKSAGRTVELFVQRVGREGRPVNKPVLIYSLVNCCGTIGSADVSRVLEGGKHLLSSIPNRPILEAQCQGRSTYSKLIP